MSKLDFVKGMNELFYNLIVLIINALLWCAEHLINLLIKLYRKVRSR